MARKSLGNSTDKSQMKSGICGFLLFFNIGLSLTADASTSCKDRAKQNREPTATECEEPLALGIAGKKFSLEEHVRWSQTVISERLGVSEDALQILSTSLNQGGGSASRNSGRGIQDCASLLRDETSFRKQFLICIASLGVEALNENLFSIFEKYRDSKPKAKNPNVEELKTLSLLAYLEDLAREVLQKKGKSVSWYDYNQGAFQAGQRPADFPFQAGDIVLTLGDSSVSAVISQSTFPPRKYSHALVIGERGPSGFEFYETLIETGSIKQSEATFKKRHLNNVLVLRWKGKSPAAPIEAARIAKGLAEAKIPYNTAMDFADTQKLFCSQFVLESFSRASGVSVQELSPVSSEIRSDPVFQYLKTLGVARKNLPSPGDLLSSPHFEVVAEYRNSEDLIYLWGMLAMADVWMERLEKGYTLSNSTFSWFQTNLGAFADGVGSLIGTDWNLLPDSLSKAAAATIMTQEDSFKRAYKAAIKSLSKKYKERSLLAIPLWEIRGHLSYALQEDWRLRSRFRP